MSCCRLRVVPIISALFSWGHRVIMTMMIVRRNQLDMDFCVIKEGFLLILHYRIKLRRLSVNTCNISENGLPVHWLRSICELGKTMLRNIQMYVLCVEFQFQRLLISSQSLYHILIIVFDGKNNLLLRGEHTI